MTDPSWLLATMAQSAAALVAIVGGFLVSRVITLSSERQGLERRARELQERSVGLGQTLAAARERRQDVSWGYFVDLAVEDCAEARGNVSPGRLARENWVRGVSDFDEMLEMARTLNAKMRRAFERLSDLDETSSSLRSATDQGMEIPAGEERIHQAAVKVIRPPRSSSELDYSRLLTSPEAAVRKSEGYERMLREERQLQAEVDALEREIAFVDTEAASVIRPAGLGWGVGVLAYLTLAGVVAPVVALAVRPVPASVASRVGLVTLFMSGLVALLAYLIRAVRQLGRTSDP